MASIARSFFLVTKNRLMGVGADVLLSAPLDSFSVPIEFRILLNTFKQLVLVV